MPLLGRLPVAQRISMRRMPNSPKAMCRSARTAAVTIPLCWYSSQKPITDFDGTGDGVGGLEPDEPGEKSAGADGIDRVGGIGERGPDECAGILLAQSEGDERQPQSEVRTLGVDGAENIGCVAGLQGPERVRIEKGDHGEDF